MRVFLFIVMICGIAAVTMLLKAEMAEHALRPSAQVDLVAPGFLALFCVVLPLIGIVSRRSGVRDGRPRRTMRRTQIPVCYENDVPVGSPYILPSGERHLVHVRQIEPPDCEYLEDLDGDDSFMVAGISRYEWVVGELLGGREIKIAAVRELENKKDRNAIRLDASWTDTGGTRREAKVGYIQATAAAAIARTYADSPLECMVDVIFAPRRGMTTGMRVHLLIHEGVKPRRRRKLRSA